MDIEHSDKNGNTGFMTACNEGNEKLIKYLIKKKVDINKCNNKLENGLILACANNNLQVVKMLIN